MCHTDLELAFPRNEKSTGLCHRDFDITINIYSNFYNAAYRRDFSINSLGFCPTLNVILDPFDGISDLENGILEVISMNTFSDDPLRILRASQFIARFQLKPSINLIKIAQNYSVLELSKERISIEINKLFSAQNTSLGILFLKEINIKTGIFFLDLFMQEADINLINLLNKLNNKFEKFIFLIVYNKKYDIRNISNDLNFLGIKKYVNKNDITEMYYIFSSECKDYLQHILNIKNFSNIILMKKLFFLLFNQNIEDLIKIFLNNKKFLNGSFWAKYGFTKEIPQIISFAKNLILKNKKILKKDIDDILNSFRI